MMIKVTHADQVHFKEWLALNLNSISWEGRYLDEFNFVWNMIFEPNVNISDLFNLLIYLESKLDQGPIISWLRWIRIKFLCFIFIHKNLTIREISELSNMNYSQTALHLRTFYIERFPYLEEQLNEKFQIGNILSGNLELDFLTLQSQLKFPDKINGSLASDVMKDLEVTLYTDWQKLKILANDKNIGIKNVESVLKDERFLTRQLKFVQELAILFVVGGLLIFAIKVGNNTYEEYLVNKISLFSPDFFWLDRNLSFKAASNAKNNNLNISFDELDALEKLESKRVFTDVAKVRRYEVESDVVLTSFDKLPKDFEAADLEQSNYEEVKKGGYRNSRYGRRKAYRIMMTSVNPNEMKANLLRIMSKYNINQVDNVKPGTRIPGGIYFNLYVPRKKLKEFLSSVSSLEDQATVLESKTVFGGPVNTNKVFVWIKSI